MRVEGFPGRLLELIGDSSRSAFARRCGLKESSIRQYLSGTMPAADTAARIAEVSGVTLQWLVTGEGNKYASERRDEPPAAPKAGNLAQTSTGLDIEFFGRVVDRVTRTYRAENVPIQPVDLGRMSAEYYSATNMLVSSPDDWPEVLDLIETRVRRSIRASIADPANVKRGA